MVTTLHGELGDLCIIVRVKQILGGVQGNKDSWPRKLLL